MQRVRKNYSFRKRIYRLTLLSGVLFIAGCMQGNTPIVQDNQPTVTVQPDPATFAVIDYYYYLDGTRVQLTPSFEWIVVKFASADPAVREGVMAGYGSPLGSLDQARDLPSSGITILSLQTGVTPQAYTELMEKMRADKINFLLANPFFYTADAGMAVGDEFIATFPPGKSRAEIDEANAAHGVELVQPILGQDHTFVLRVTGGAELDALSMANLYQESGIALQAAPNFIRIKN